MTFVCLDANVVISYLLAPGADRPVTRVIRAAFNRQFELSLSETTLQEAAESISSKPYLAVRIDEAKAARFLARLRRLATIAPEIREHLPLATRDPGDDYLIAHALLADVDYLVTGDKDLLVLGEVAGVRIVSPATFVSLLNELP